MYLYFQRSTLPSEGLRTPKESWEKLDSLFNKQDDIRGHILENELVYLHPITFETIE